MTAPQSAVPVAVLRDAVEARRREVGLRAVAREVGLSATGLAGFLKGRQSYSHTLTKLTGWYLHTQATRHQLAPEAAAAILDQLLQHLPPRWRTKTRRGLIERIAADSRDAQVELPRWLRTLTKPNQD